MSGHHIGLTEGQPPTWVTYCIECSEAAQDWVAVCTEGTGWHHVPPRVLISVERAAGVSGQDPT